MALKDPQLLPDYVNLIYIHMLRRMPYTASQPRSIEAHIPFLHAVPLPISSPSTPQCQFTGKEAGTDRPPGNQAHPALASTSDSESARRHTACFQPNGFT